MQPFAFPIAGKLWSLEPGHVFRHGKCHIPGTRRLFRHLGMQKGPEEFSDMGECEKDLWVAGKMFWYQQRDCPSVVIEFSDGKLKQKDFFHSVVITSCLGSFEWSNLYQITVHSLRVKLMLTTAKKLGFFAYTCSNGEGGFICWRSDCTEIGCMG
jgi:hypothetical protein